MEGLNKFLNGLSNEKLNEQLKTIDEQVNGIFLLQKKESEEKTEERKKDEKLRDRVRRSDKRDKTDNLFSSIKKLFGKKEEEKKEKKKGGINKLLLKLGIGVAGGALVVAAGVAVKNAVDGIIKDIKGQFDDFIKTITGQMDDKQKEIEKEIDVASEDIKEITIPGQTTETPSAEGNVEPQSSNEPQLAPETEESAIPPETSTPPKPEKPEKPDKPEKPEKTPPKPKKTPRGRSKAKKSKEEPLALQIGGIVRRQSGGEVEQPHSNINVTKQPRKDKILDERTFSTTDFTDGDTVVKKQEGGLVLFQGHGDVPIGHAAPGTDGPGTKLQGKYKPTAEQHFINQVAVTTENLANKEGVPISYQRPTGRYASASAPGANWKMANDLRAKGKSAIELHFDAWGYDNGKYIEGKRGILKGGRTPLLPNERNVEDKFGVHPSSATRTWGTLMLELDALKYAQSRINQYARMLVDAVKGDKSAKPKTEDTDDVVQEAADDVQEFPSAADVPSNVDFYYNTTTEKHYKRKEEGGFYEATPNGLPIFSTQADVPSSVKLYYNSSTEATYERSETGFKKLTEQEVKQRIPEGKSVVDEDDKDKETQLTGILAAMKGFFDGFFSEAGIGTDFGGLLKGVAGAASGLAGLLLGSPTQGSTSSDSESPSKEVIDEVVSKIVAKKFASHADVPSDVKFYFNTTTDKHYRRKKEGGFYEATEKGYPIFAAAADVPSDIKMYHNSSTSADYKRIEGGFEKLQSGGVVGMDMSSMPEFKPSAAAVTDVMMKSAETGKMPTFQFGGVVNNISPVNMSANVHMTNNVKQNLTPSSNPQIVRMQKANQTYMTEMGDDVQPVVIIEAPKMMPSATPPSQEPSPSFRGSGGGSLNMVEAKNKIHRINSGAMF